MPFDYDEFKSFFSPESAANEPKFHPYNFTSQFLYDTDLWDEQPIIDLSQIENTKAWSTYAGTSEAAVAEELYGSDGSKKNSLGLKAILKQKGKTEALEYLQLAKDIETNDNSNSSNSDTTQINDKLKYEGWLSTIQSKYNQTNDSFLKERWAYQAVKVADMAGTPQKSIELYKRLVEPLATKTFISDWARSRLAGAYMHAGDSTQAYYHFSQVFVTAPTRRKEAHLSLRIYLPKLQEEALKLCKNDSEKANVYASTAVLPFQDALPMLEKMRDLDASNALIEFVMAREINKNEQFFFTSREDLEYAYWGVDSLKKNSLKSEAPNYFNKLLGFSLASADNASLKSSPFWYTAASYLTFIAKDYKTADELLKKAKAIPTTQKGLQDQIAMQEMILTVYQSLTITPQLEQAIMPFLERFARSANFRTANNFNAVCKLLAAKYRGLNNPNEFSEVIQNASLKTTAEPQETKSLGWLTSCFSKKENASAKVTAEDKAKSFIMSILASSQLGYSIKREDWIESASFMSNSDQYAIEDSTSSNTLKDVLNYFSKKAPSDFDTRLVKLTGLNTDYVYTVLGKRALAEHRYAEATEAWKNIAPAIWEAEPYKTYLDVNPFHLNGKGEANASERVTPLSFATRMAALQEKVKANPNDFQSWFLLGCGSYNMSYHGNSWILLRRAWSSTETPDESYDYYTYEKALSYFDKAMTTAPNPELAATACFFASACQKIRLDIIHDKLYADFYTFSDEEREKKEVEIKQTLTTLRKEKYSTYFNLLKTKYGQTNYEEQLINECSTYKDYITGK